MSFVMFQVSTLIFASASSLNPPISSYHPHSIQCDDQFHGIWPMEPLLFNLNVTSDLTSLELDACHSSFDTNLRFFDANSTVPIAVDDDGCNNLFGSSRISLTDILSGEYLIELGAD